jgi:hypothetical protein
LNRLPELKSFLLDGEAESYEGVTVEYVHGRTAVMTIFLDGAEKEQVPLHTIQTKPKMHELMVKKGFVKKASEKKPDEGNAPKDEAGAIVKNKAEKEERLLKREEELGRVRENLELSGHKARPPPATSAAAPFQTVFRLYGLLGMSLVVLVGYARGRQRLKRRRNTNAASVVPTTGLQMS